jgi:predicted nucleic acid-binding protein
LTIVISDTSPICYLLLIGEIEILPQLYGQVSIPQIVGQELADERSPEIVKTWISQPPEWLTIQTVNVPSQSDLDDLDPGERAAIVLAEQQGADLLIIDDLLGRRIALSRQLRVTGLLGVLDEAARQNLLDFSGAIARLQQTTFRASSKLIQSLLQRHQKENDKGFPENKTSNVYPEAGKISTNQ